MKSFLNRISLFFIPTLFLGIILGVLCIYNYINLSDIVSVYLPIWLVGMAAALFKKIVFANTFIFLASLGLIGEYIIHILNKPHPNMSGGFLNTLLLVLGLVLGIVLQIFNSRRQK